MTEKELKAKENEIFRSVDELKLKPAFDILGYLISEYGLGIFYDEYRNIEETYRFILKYTVEGTRDPEREKVYRKLIVSVYELADKVVGKLRLKYSSSAEYDKKRSLSKPVIGDTGVYLTEIEDFYLQDKETSEGYGVGNAPETTPGHSGETSHENGKKKSEEKGQESYDASEHIKKIHRLFYHIWFTDSPSSDEAKQWRKIVFSTVLPAHYKAFMVTAVTLSLLRYFDKEKLMILFDTYNPEEPEISQRALIGLLTGFYRYDSRLRFYPQISGRLRIMTEDSGFRRNIEHIIIQFIKSKDTEKLQKRIRDELLPEMIKISPHLKNKINLESLMEEGLAEDRNPDWEDIFKDSPGFLSKIEEFSEMQMKGDDVFLGSFSMLKSFPFFGEMSNWFLPFFAENPEIHSSIDTEDETEKNLVNVISKVPVLCNSDKYSLCFSINRLPKDNLKFMAQAMKAETEQMDEIREDEELIDPEKKTGFVSNRYIQDLYRFYKLYPRRKDFKDLFSWRLDFHNKSVLGAIIKEDPKMMRNIAEYYFAKDHYKDAADIFNYLVEKNKIGELYQKIAWCYQKTGNYSKALDYYLKAELYDINHQWNNKKIAFCYRNLKKPEKALEYYKVVEGENPDDLGNQLNTGHCLLEMNRFDEALQSYFKVEYLAPGNKKVWRPIAWCSFLTGKLEQAEKYLLKLMEEQPNKHDLINMGHLQWALGNRESALEYYRRSIKKEDFDNDKQKTGQKGFTGYNEKATSTTGTKGSHSDKEKTSADKGKEASKNAGKESDDKRFALKEFMEVFEEDTLHLLNQGIDKNEIPIMLDQLRYLLN